METTTTDFLCLYRICKYRYNYANKIIKKHRWDIDSHRFNFIDLRLTIYPELISERNEFKTINSPIDIAISAMLKTGKQ